MHPQTTIHYRINFMTNTSVDAIIDTVNNTNNTCFKYISIINPVRKYLLFAILHSHLKNFSLSISDSKVFICSDHCQYSTYLHFIIWCFGCEWVCHWILDTDTTYLVTHVRKHLGAFLQLGQGCDYNSHVERWCSARKHSSYTAKGANCDVTAAAGMMSSVTQKCGIHKYIHSDVHYVYAYIALMYINYTWPFCFNHSSENSSFSLENIQSHFNLLKLLNSVTWNSPICFRHSHSVDWSVASHLYNLINLCVCGYEIYLPVTLPFQLTNHVFWWQRTQENHRLDKSLWQRFVEPQRRHRNDDKKLQGSILTQYTLRTSLRLQLVIPGKTATTDKWPS